jgi:hypothetical protein
LLSFGRCLEIVDAHRTDADFAEPASRFIIASLRSFMHMISAVTALAESRGAAS